MARQIEAVRAFQRHSQKPISHNVNNKSKTTVSSKQHAPVHTTIRDKPKSTLAEKEKKRKDMALLRAANRGSSEVSIADVNAAVKQVEESSRVAPSTRPSPPSSHQNDLRNRQKLPTSISNRRHTPVNSTAAHKQFNDKSPKSKSNLPAVVIPDFSTSRGKSRRGKEPSRRSTAERKRSGPVKVVVGGVVQPPGVGAGGRGVNNRLTPVNDNKGVDVSNAVLRSAQWSSSCRPMRRPQPRVQEQYDDDDDEDLADFIDDGTNDADDWRRELRTVTGYNPQAFGGIDEGEACESSVMQQDKEERYAAKMAQKEDAEQLRLIQVTTFMIVVTTYIHDTGGDNPHTCHWW